MSNARSVSTSVPAIVASSTRPSDVDTVTEPAVAPASTLALVSTWVRPSATPEPVATPIGVATRTATMLGAANWTILATSPPAPPTAVRWVEVSGVLSPSSAPPSASTNTVTTAPSSAATPASPHSSPPRRAGVAAV